MIEKGVRNQDTQLHQASPAKTEPASVKHCSVKAILFVLLSYIIRC